MPNCLSQPIFETIAIRYRYHLTSSEWVSNIMCIVYIVRLLWNTPTASPRNKTKKRSEINFCLLCFNFQKNIMDQFHVFDEYVICGAYIIENNLISCDMCVVWSGSAHGAYDIDKSFSNILWHKLSGNVEVDSMHETLFLLNFSYVNVRLIRRGGGRRERNIT